MAAAVTPPMQQVHRPTQYRAQELSDGLPDGLWVFCVTPVDAAPGAWLVTSSSRPHRDSLGPDPNIVEQDRREYV